MKATAPMISDLAPREIWPDATPGPYLLHDGMGAVQLVQVDRSRDKLVVRFDGCDEDFLAEDLSAVFEGPLTGEQAAAAAQRLSAQY